jgi:hypothetical protein
LKHKKNKSNISNTDLPVFGNLNNYRKTLMAILAQRVNDKTKIKNITLPLASFKEGCFTPQTFATISL